MQNKVQVHRELAFRGWSQADLARASGLSVATIRAALAGKPVAANTLRRIEGALSAPPHIDDEDLRQ